MKILIDERVPAGLQAHLSALGHECQSAREVGLAGKKNGELLALAEGRWNVLLTPDRNIKYQQNLAGRNISILILCAQSNRVRELLPLMPACAQALLSMRVGEIVEVGKR